MKESVRTKRKKKGCKDKKMGVATQGMKKEGAKTQRRKTESARL